MGQNLFEKFQTSGGMIFRAYTNNNHNNNNGIQQQKQGIELLHCNIKAERYFTYIEFSHTNGSHEKLPWEKRYVETSS